MNINDYPTVKIDPVMEAIACKLSGIEGVPLSEKSKMVKRAVKAGRDALKAPRVMLPYTEDCKPEESGWYWYGGNMGAILIAYYHDGMWRESSTFKADEYFDDPKYWLPLEATPVLPKQ